MTANTACTATPRKIPAQRPFVEFYLNLKLRWRNWRTRKTARAYAAMCEAMKNDPEYAHSWHCNIAMPLYDNSKGVMSIDDANAHASNLMFYLFGVRTARK